MRFLYFFPYPYVAFFQFLRDAIIEQPPIRDEKWHRNNAKNMPYI